LKEEAPTMKAEPSFAVPEPEPIAVSRAVAGFRRSPLLELLATTYRPGIVSFAVGMPATDLLPAERLAQATALALAGDRAALQYQVPPQRLKAHVVELMARRGVECSEDEVFLTAGAQQGMDLVARLLVDPGARVLLDDTAYEGMQMVLRALAPEVVPVPTHPGLGIDVDAVERLLAAGPRPALLYTIPAGHNPLGCSMPPERAARLVELARRLRMPILEDDAYGFLSYRPQPAPPLRALDDRWVLYLGSFSKILAPSLRAGWLVVPPELIPRLSILKHAIDLDVTTLAQRTLVAYLDTGDLPRHLEHLRGEYRRRRDAMLAAMAAHLPPPVRWNVPDSGIYLWVELPSGADAVELLRFAAAREAVAFSPGAAFATGGGDHARHCLRLCFSSLPSALIEEGVARLGRALVAFLREPPAAPEPRPSSPVRRRAVSRGAKPRPTPRSPQ
jgi:2-aminoadipate transaminase